MDYNGTRGWVAGWYTTVSGSLSSVPVSNETGAAAPTQSTGVTASTTVNLRVRSGPGTSYDTVTVLAQGTTVDVLNRTPDSQWIYIQRGGVRGWMAAWYTQITGDLNAVPLPGGEAPSVAPTTPTAGSSVTAAPTVNLRMRSGPGTNYRELGYIPAGTSVPVLGRNEASNWLYVEYNGSRVWIAAWYTNVSGSLASVPVTSDTGTVVSAPPAPGTGSLPPDTGFVLGGQTHTLSRPDIMQASGMTWVKFQQKWYPGLNPGDLAGKIQAAHDQGFRVLISAPGPLYPDSIDYASYVQYLKGVALVGADAIEVWNEMNLNREWPSGQVDPASYVNNMLAPAYREIKAVNPNTMVIIGALAPTGVNVGNDIWSDDRYLAGMAAAGAASYADCLGVHHNAGASSPDATTGHPAAPEGGHDSWYFWPTFNVYANAFPNTPLSYTELGYVTSDGYPPLPQNFSWASDNDVWEHAQWLGRAVQHLRASGRVRMAIIFNVDFTVYEPDDPQAGYAILRPDGSCPACAQLAGAMQ